MSEDAAAGTVKSIRGIDSHFLTAQECILAGHLQNQHPNVSKYASSGVFGSKFVTVCVTGKMQFIHTISDVYLISIYLFFRRLKEAGAHGGIRSFGTVYGAGA